MTRVPLHERIRSEIEQRILSGAWPPGYRIPSEHELMAEYGCARMTVNKALTALAGAGLVERRKRAGSRVARPLAQSMILDVPDLAGEVIARGQAYDWRLLSRRVRPAAKPWEEGEVLEIEGVHSADREPLAFERRQVSLRAVPAIAGADLAAEAPGTWLLGHVPWTEAENRIAAAGADAQAARALGIAAGEPCLCVTRRTWRETDTITRVEQYFPAGRYELVARFGTAGAS
ncbi:MAG: UTRA domain-containing protein [Sphingomonadales bacterium]|nr:UTRA domain-containing protein [Sphingomonadales bacterium]MDE2569687.1 UTRA domain-containing protein [Sphingomonadales bacterium]